MNNIIKKIYDNDFNFISNDCNKSFLNFENILNDYIQNENAKEKIENSLSSFSEFFDVLYKENSTYDEKNDILNEALDYSMLSQGKRLRPFLMYLTHIFLGGKKNIIAHYLLAIEMIHTFSLVHDDLPAMDNDELRRGKLTVWKKYGEDMAILVGDELLNASALLSINAIYEFSNTNYLNQSILASHILLKHTGKNGMISGQVYDVLNTKNSNLSINDLEYMYNKKTSSLLYASLSIGAIFASFPIEKLHLIESLANYIGLSYQIKDDLLEVESTEENIGKSINSDKNNNKITYISKLGIENSKNKLLHLYDETIKIINELTNDENKKISKFYIDMINYMLERKK